MTQKSSPNKFNEASWYLKKPLDSLQYLSGDADCRLNTYIEMY